MRNVFIVLWMLLCPITSALAQLSIGIGLPSVTIGLNLNSYPSLVVVPGYPVYYAPQLRSNYFFYDGMYWVYERDNWYASSWYNGPWGLVGPDAVPLFILRVPVRYYRQPPVYFRGWSANSPPQWGQHWGNAWEQQRHGWDRWDRRAQWKPAPLPTYQRQYSGSRYPRMEQQSTLQGRNYQYKPQEVVVQQHYQTQRMQAAPPPSAQGRPNSVPQGAPQAPHAQTPPSRQGGSTAQPQKPPAPQNAGQRESQAPRSQGQGKPQQAPESRQGQGKPQQAPESSQGHGKGQQAPQPKQGSDKGNDKGKDNADQRDRERNK